jgi:hypothetical protein
MKNILKLIIISLVLVPSITYASWWNPFTWFHKKVTPQIQSQTSQEQKPRNQDMEQAKVDVVRTSQMSEVANIEGGEKYSYRISDKDASLVINGEVTQKIVIDKTANQVSLNKRFITSMDINFDGNVDLGVFSETGSGGANIFYTFYVYDVVTNQLMPMISLSNGEVGISNPEIDKSKKQIRSSMKGGATWSTDIFQFDGTKYYKLN